MNKRLFIRNSAVMTATSLLLRLFGIVFRIFLSRRVGAEGMGLYQLVFSVYVLAGAFASAGITTAVTRLVGEQLARGNPAGAKRVLRTSVWLCLAVGLATAAALAVGAPWLAVRLGDPRTVLALQVAGVPLPFAGVSACLGGYFLARRNAGPAGIAQIVMQASRIGGIAALLAIVGDCPTDRACRIILLGDVIAEVIGCAILTGMYAADRKHLPRQAKPARLPLSRRYAARNVLQIAVPLAAGRYLTSGLRTAETVLVPLKLAAYTHSDSLALQQFGAVKGMALPLLFFPATFLMTVTGLLIPELSDAKALGQRRQVTRLTEQTLRLTVAAGVWIGGLFTCFGRLLGELLYHDETVGMILQYLGPLTPVMILDSTSTGLLRGLGEQVMSLVYTVIDSVTRIILVWVLLPRYGLMGFLFIMVVSNLLTAFLSTHRLMKVSGTGKGLGTAFAVPVLCALLSGICLRLIGRFLPFPGGWIGLSTGSCILSGIYFLLLWLCGGTKNTIIGEWKQKYSVHNGKSSAKSLTKYAE